MPNPSELKTPSAPDMPPAAEIPATSYIVTTAADFPAEHTSFIKIAQPNRTTGAFVDWKRLVPKEGWKRIEIAGIPAEDLVKADKKEQGEELFASEEELDHFFEKHLIKNIAQHKREAVLAELRVTLHQGGLLTPLCSAAAHTVDKAFNKKIITRDSLAKTGSVSFQTTNTGFTVTEVLIQPKLYYGYLGVPEELFEKEAFSPDNPSEKNYVYTAEAVIQVDCSGDALAFTVTKNSIDYGNQQVQKILGGQASVEEIEKILSENLAEQLLEESIEKRLEKPVEEPKNLLLTANSTAMRDWLAFDPWPVGWGKRLVWLLSLPVLAIKATGGSLAYLLALGFERALKRAREGQAIYYLPAVLIGLLYLPLRALFLPMESLRAASRYSHNPWIRVPLMVLSMLLTAGAWMAVAAFALPVLLAGLSLSVSAVFASVTSLFASWGAAAASGVGLAVTPGVAAQIGSAIAATGIAFAMGLWRAVKAVAGWRFGFTPLTRAEDSPAGAPAHPDLLSTTPSVSAMSYSAGKASITASSLANATPSISSYPETTPSVSSIEPD